MNFIGSAFIFPCMKLHEVVKITEQHTNGEESIIYGGMHVFIINSKLYFQRTISTTIENNG